MSDEMSDGMGDERSDGPGGKAAGRWSRIEEFLEHHGAVGNADVRRLCGVSASTANRILRELAAEGKLVKCRRGGHWAYRRPERRPPGLD